MQNHLMAYLKFIAALAGVAAQVALAVAVGPPAWVYVVVSVATALGVGAVPNKLLNDALAFAEDAAREAGDVRARDYPQAAADGRKLLADGEAVVQDVRNDWPK